jgi:cation diffusion facilitator family transporter
LIIAARPKDHSHPYGHGKVEFISAGAEGTMILIAGLYIIWESVRSFWYPPELAQLNTGIVIVGISAIVNFGTGYWAYRTGKRNHSPALMASGRHLQTDTYTTIGIIAGLLLVQWTDLIWMDAVTALIVAFLIIRMGWAIIRKAIAGIMDESDEQLLEELVAYLQANRDQNWVDLHNLRIVKYGSVLHVDCHLTVPWYFTVKEGHTETEKLEELIHKEFGERIELNIHTDYCHDFSCPLCAIEDCQVRKHAFREHKKWTVANVVSVKKHRLSKE